MNGSQRPSKYQALLDVADLVTVPALCCLGPDYFSRELADGDALFAAVGRLMHEISATAGSALGQHFAQLSQLIEGARLRAGAIQRLTRTLDDTFGSGALARESFAVRSAAEGEDGTKHSYAGLYETVLDVRGPVALEDAIERVWKSYFSYPALLERLKSGRLDHTPRMHVVIQRLVRAEFAGVAFTRDPVSGSAGLVIELVRGLGDALVSGASTAQRFTAHDALNGELDPTVRGLLMSITGAIDQLRTRLDGDLDVEWAWQNGQLFVLQVRPMTTAGASRRTDCSPRFEVARLFAATDDELEPFRPLDEFAEYVRRKRGPLFRLGAEFGAPAGAAFILQCNRAGYEQQVSEFVARFTSDEVVMDSGPHLRQHIMPRARLAEEIGAVCGRPGEVHQFVIRDFIRGSQGLISRPAHESAVFCELSAEGLLALNRGTASTQVFDLGDDSAAGRVLPRDQAELVRRITLAAQDRLGACQLEWVVWHERVFLVDYSPLRDALPLGSPGEHRVISHGFAEGPALHIANDDYLRKMSEGPAVSLTGIPELEQLDSVSRDLLATVRDAQEPPIVFAARPLAILAVLIPHAAGFVFEQASTLCHLAILLREHGVPAIELATPPPTSTLGARVTLDTHAATPLALQSKGSPS